MNRCFCQLEELLHLLSFNLAVHASDGLGTVGDCGHYFFGVQDVWVDDALVGQIHRVSVPLAESGLYVA